MEDVAKAFAAVALLAVLGFFMGQCVRWRFDECKKVGHSTFYCVVEAGRE